MASFLLVKNFVDRKETGRHENPPKFHVVVQVLKSCSELKIVI